MFSRFCPLRHRCSPHKFWPAKPAYPCSQVRRFRFSRRITRTHLSTGAARSRKRADFAEITVIPACSFLSLSVIKLLKRAPSTKPNRPVVPAAGTLLLLAAAFVQPLPAQDYPGPKAAGTGDFVLHSDTLYQPVGGAMMGVVNPAVAGEAVQIYGEVVQPMALVRTNLHLHRPNRSNEAARRISMARDAGLRALITCAGTPLWNSSEPNGEPYEYATLPPYARAVPIDMQAWADDLVSVLQEMEQNHNILPDYIEVWNEPDRPEWWNGSGRDYLDLLEITANTLVAAFPSKPFKIGGCGLAAGTSTMEYSESLLIHVVKNAALSGHPLDFVSWHHYHLSTGLRYYDTANQVRTAMLTTGSTDLELIVSEWNISPSPTDNPDAIEFDSSHAAANLAGFLATAAQQEIAGNAFFMLHDVQDQGGIADLTGKANGALTYRGIKKPVFRVMEFMYGMASEPRVRVDYPVGELAVSILATRLDDRIRLVISNDVTEGDWIWTEGCRSFGASPGKLTAATRAVLGNNLPLTRENLIAEGLEEWEADAVLEIVPEYQTAKYLERHLRSVDIDIQGFVSNINLTEAWRFDSTHNAPVTRRDELVPLLEWVEDQAQSLAYDAMATYLISVNVDPPPPGSPIPESIEDFAKDLQTTYEIAENAWLLYHNTLSNERLAHTEFLNNQPATTLVSEIPTDAGIQLNANVLTIDLEPDSVTILDIEF